jgi:hypothetical protein
LTIFDCIEQRFLIVLLVEEMGIHGLMKLINEEVTAVFSLLFFCFPFSGVMS